MPTPFSTKYGPQILIVEDDTYIAKLLRLMLKQHGYAADIASTVAEARTRLVATNHAAMTLDLNLPGESGIRFLRELRSHPATSSLPVVVVSAVAESGQQLGSGDDSLVVLDIGLPDGSGLDLLPLIHALEPPSRYGCFQHRNWMMIFEIRWQQPSSNHALMKPP